MKEEAVSGWTKGPWKFAEWGLRKYWGCILGKDNVVVASIHQLPNESKHNAHLIAEALAMHGALTKLCAAIKLIPEDTELHLLYEEGEEDQSIGDKIHAAEADARTILARLEARP